MTESNWRLEGDYFEACNCDTICPCVFLGNPDQGECDVTIAWHIDKGHFDNTSLDELNVVGVFHTPGNMWTGPKWKAALYLDERATKEQVDALGTIYSGRAGGFFGIISGFVGELAGVRQMPINFEMHWVHQLKFKLRLFSFSIDSNYLIATNHLVLFYYILRSIKQSFFL